MRKKYVTLNNNYTIIYLKTGIKIDLHDFLRGVFVMKVTIKENEITFPIILLEIPNCYILKKFKI